MFGGLFTYIRPVELDSWVLGWVALGPRNWGATIHACVKTFVAFVFGLDFAEKISGNVIRMRYRPVVEQRVVDCGVGV